MAKHKDFSKESQDARRHDENKVKHPIEKERQRQVKDEHEAHSKHQHKK